MILRFIRAALLHADFNESSCLLTEIVLRHMWYRWDAKIRRCTFRINDDFFPFFQVDLISTIIGWFDGEVSFSGKNRIRNVSHYYARLAGEAFYMYKLSLSLFPAGRNFECSFCAQTGIGDIFPGIRNSREIRIFPPQLCISMSWMHWAPDNGVSITGPASLYIVVGLRNFPNNLFK